MKITSEQLIQDLLESTRVNINEAENFKKLSAELLNKRTAPTSWSILECLEHLNLYGDFYIAALTDSISKSKTAPQKEFNSGLLGNYFANSMKPKAKLNKMATFKDKNPLGSKLDHTTIDRFIDQQTTMLQLLNQSRKVDLSKTKVPISITKYIKLKLGDTFRFVIYHNDRHIAQALKLK